MSKHINKVTALAASSLLFSVVAQAYQDKGFLITGGATYLETSHNGLDYVDVISSTAGGNSIKTHHFDPSFTWGYFLGVGYTINKDYDVQATWTEFDSNQTKNTEPEGSVDGATGYITSNGEVIPLPTGHSVTAHTHDKLNTQAFTADVGFYQEISEALNVRFSAGIQYAKVDSRVTNTYEDAVFPTAPFDIYSSKFNGVGPEAGMDLEYKITDSNYGTFGVVGKLAAAFLIGEQESNSNVFFSSVSGDQHEVNSQANVRMIPALNAKLGINWGLIEAGYQVAYYYNAVDQIQYMDASSEVTHNYSSVGIMGPYVNFSATF